MAQEFWLIRHAESSMNLQPHTINGRMNEIPLTEKGEQQAQLLGEYLATQSVDFYRVYTSPAIRTLMTARISLAATGFLNPDLVICNGLQEMDQGEWTGQVRTKVMLPSVRRRMHREGINAKAPGGESMYEVAVRAGNELRDIVDTDGEQNVPKLVYTHGVAIRSVVGSICGWSRSDIYNAKTENTSITKVTLQDNVLYHNSEYGFNLTPHLMQAA